METSNKSKSMAGTTRQLNESFRLKGQGTTAWSGSPSSSEDVAQADDNSVQLRSMLRFIKFRL